MLAWLREQPAIHDASELWLYGQRSEGKATRALDLVVAQLSAGCSRAKPIHGTRLLRLSEVMSMSQR